jgi:tetratricopeptide (TPR) repeat protein
MKIVNNDKYIENKVKILLNVFNTSNFNLVISQGKKLIKEFPQYVILYNIIGSAYQNIGKYSLAKEIFLKGYKMDPRNIAIMNNLANTYKNLEEITLAENLFNKIINEKPDYINAYVNLGNLKRDINDFTSALKLYNKALNINDKIPVILYSLALAYQGLGEFEKAIDYSKKTLLLDPKFTQADILISQSTKYKIDNNHYNEMKKKFNEINLSTDQKINLSFALAKANEDIGNIEIAFNHLKHGNHLKRQSLVFDIKNEIKLFKSIKQAFQKINFDQFQEVNNDKKNIIFILGMPRSGTTLIEQIISSHSNVFGSGELPYLSKNIKEEIMNENVISYDKFDNFIKNPKIINDIKNNYYHCLEKFNPKENFTTDKAPLNFRWIGFIKILFPNAKIIHCSRNPKDNCLSLYKNLFEGGLSFSYDEKELGTYYNLYVDLMNYWEGLFPNTIYQARYENIIKNQDSEIRKIIKFCNLSWEDSCLLFHKNKTPIKTMSTAQAREPIYKSSLNSYEKFSPFLQTLNKII